MPPPRSRYRHSRGVARSAAEPGLIYERAFLEPNDRAALAAFLDTLWPLWEQRFSAGNPPPPGQAQRQLLRPVYWLGNWQFACLDYYRPPAGIRDRCVRAEPFPPVLARLVREVEERTREEFRPQDIPAGWHLDTCLVNFYGDRVGPGGKRVDTARVGEHKDFEPGPVASISLGERALFQFVRSSRPGERDAVVAQQWLDDSSLQIFGGDRWKKQVFHRVQRVDRRDGHRFALHLEDPREPAAPESKAAAPRSERAAPESEAAAPDSTQHRFETRRVNLTLRYVPDAHVVPFAQLSARAADDVRGYMEKLASHSPFFARELAAR